MNRVWHLCGQPLEVGQAYNGSRTSPVFLDHQTGDGLEHCPKCGGALQVCDLKCQRPAPKAVPNSASRVSGTPSAGNLPRRNASAQRKRLREAARFVKAVRARKAAAK